MTTVSANCALLNADSDIADSAIQALLENLGTSSSCIVFAAGHHSVHHASLLPRLCSVTSRERCPSGLPSSRSIDPNQDPHYPAWLAVFVLDGKLE